MSRPSNKKRSPGSWHLTKAQAPRRKSRREVTKGNTGIMRVTSSVERNITTSNTVCKSLKIPRGLAKFLNLQVNSVSSLTSSDYPNNNYDRLHRGKVSEISNFQHRTIIQKVQGRRKNLLVMDQLIRNQRVKLEAVYMQMATNLIVYRH